ncbi:MAG: XRE family transcriptional regulator [Actinomycetota bacterium]|nr:XRE family transcriptional regulator [Actinomycetota bacterium]
MLASVVGTGSNSSATPDVVDELARRLVRLRKLDIHLGGADTYHLYAAEADLSTSLITEGTNLATVHRGLLSVHAEQSQQAGWAAFDAGWHGIAKDHYRRSYAAATEAGDLGLAGNALAFRAYQLIALDRPARAISEKSVHVAAQASVDPGVRALLYSRAAWTFALDGDSETTARCLGLAEEALAHAAPGQTPDYASWVDETELAIMTGRCWSELRRPLRAVPVLESALSRYSDVHARDKALYSSWLAGSYIDAGEIEQAAKVVKSSLAVMGDVASVRPRQRLGAVAARLSEHRDLSVVRDLLSSDSLNPLDIRR